jgi:hypothetical protein
MIESFTSIIGNTIHCSEAIILARKEEFPDNMRFADRWTLFHTFPWNFPSR